MNFQTFTKKLICKAQIYLGEDFDLEISIATKNNNKKLTGIMAKKKGLNVFPTFYVDDFYKEEMVEEDIDYLAMKIAHGIKNIKYPSESCIEDFVDLTKAGNRIAYKLINAEKNKNLLSEIPHRRFHNLVICYYYQIEDGYEIGKGSILIRNTHLKEWNIDEETLFEIAHKNSKEMLPSQMVPIKELLNDMYGSRIVNEDLPMYVLSNTDRTFGASAILYENELRNIAKELGDSFYVLPSSVHEVIVIPESTCVDADNLLTIVTQINKSEVAWEEVLSDSVYYYDRDKEELIWKC